MSEQLIQKAHTHVSEILRDALLHESGETMVIYDEMEPFTRLLTEAYRRALPNARFIRFEDQTKETILAELETLHAGDLVVQIQSTNFRLDDFRIRIFLFREGLKAIEHAHLNRIPENEWDTYVNALHYDKNYYHPLGHGVRDRLRSAQRTEVRSHDTLLVYDTPFEEPKLNIGDYREMQNKGGTFPIGEVFTEAQDLTKVNGEARIFAFAGIDFKVNIYDPFKVIIKDGILYPTEEAPQAFLEILDLITATEPVYVRELGLGLNRAITKEHILSDVTAFERINGMHLSLGAKHSIYGKPGFKKDAGRYHIDVFVQADEITLDGEVLFKDWEYVL